MLGRDQPMILQMLEIPDEKAQKALKGVMMELDDCAFPLLQGMAAASEPEVAFRDVDIALLVGARPRGPGMERKDLLEANGRIFAPQGRALDKVAKRDVKVLVVGNPANTNCLIAMKNAPGLKPAQFTGMMRLDHNRAVSQIAHKVAQPVSSVRKVTVWGNHSATQYPDIFQAEADGKKVWPMINDQTWLEQTFIPTIQKRGAAIIDARGLSSAASAANAAIDHVRDWIGGTREGDWVTMGIAAEGSYRAIYLSGAGVSASSLGMPDLGISNLDDVLTDIRRITELCDLPLLVDVDTGFGVSAFNVARTTRSLIKAGAAAMHIEDQAGAKRCGHRPGKELVGGEEMADRVKAAVDARTDPSFVIMARTDALANEGLDAAISRAVKYVEVGADMIFPEALTELAMYRKFAAAVKVPILANITEFGRTPLFSVAELRSADVAIALYPLTAFRAMNKAALRAFETVRREGSQKALLPEMQTREELYEFLNYHSYEKKLDELFSRGKAG